MLIKLILHGKTDNASLQLCMDDYIKRLQRYGTFSVKVIPDDKSLVKAPVPVRMKKEGEELMKNIDQKDVVVLLDEKGKQFTSVAFASFIEARVNASVKNLVFVVGGPYGFTEEVYKRADFKISLSDMTFSHQIVRLLFLEQLYRAFTIIRGEPYHHS
ncbi:MAG: 23S rRNA (pseudouridine(1915)-N(3))-methyltransferase RlmH [Bacteroidota bacterium]